VKSYDSKRKLKAFEIVVQSPLIRDALGSVLDNYPGITTGISNLTFSPPFEPFVHRWVKFRAVLEREQDPKRKAHIELLYRILEEELSDQIRARDDLIAHGVITFDYLYMIFEPGSIIYSSKHGQPCAVRLVRGNYGTDACGGRFYNLQCEYVDWDGARFGLGTTYIRVGAFDGTTPITSISALPAIYHPDRHALRDKLIERGREFERLSGFHYRAYQGIAFGEDMFGRPAKYNVSLFLFIFLPSDL
jgi:hypothetical protein